MNNNQNDQIIKRGRGRPRVLTDEERIKNKTNYMLNTSWYCDICKTGRDYTLAGKSCHMKTKKHAKNANEINNIEQINRITQILNP